MVASVQNRSIDISHQQFVPMSELENLTLKNDFLKRSRNSSKVKIFDLLVLTFKVPNVWEY